MGWRGVKRGTGERELRVGEWKSDGEEVVGSSSFSKHPNKSEKLQV